MEKNAHQLKAEFDKLPNDIERWKWVKEHQDTGIIVYLDNDDTHGILPDPNDDNDVVIFQFDEYVGWADGIESLLASMGIKAECV